MWPPVAAQAQPERDDPTCHSGRAPGLSARLGLVGLGALAGPMSFVSSKRPEMQDAPLPQLSLGVGGATSSASHHHSCQCCFRNLG